MKPQDELWWACLDGEMTPAGAAQYDKTLSEDERRLMSAEMEMEHGLGRVLARPAPGADAAWLAAMAQVKAREEEARHGASRRWRRMVLAVVPAAVAAVALVVFGAGYMRAEAPKPSFLSVGARDVVERTSAAQAQEVMATARTMLRGRDMHMAFDPGNSLQSEDAPYRLVSVRRDERAGEPVVEMVFMCGGKPAKVIITNGGGSVAHEIGRATARGAALASRSVGDWLVTAVGVDTPDRLLSLIEEAQPEPREQSVPVSETPMTEMSAPGVAGANDATDVPEHAVGVPDTAAAPAPDAAAAAPQSAQDAAVVPPDTAVAAPQSAPDEVPHPPASPTESKPVDTMI